MKIASNNAGMDFMRAFSKNMFNLFDLTATIFIFNFSRSINSVVHGMMMVIAVSALLHFYEFSKRKQALKAKAV